MKDRSTILVARILGPALLIFGAALLAGRVDAALVETDGERVGIERRQVIETRPGILRRQQTRAPHRRRARRNESD